MKLSPPKNPGSGVYVKRFPFCATKPFDGCENESMLMVLLSTSESLLRTSTSTGVSFEVLRVSSAAVGGEFWPSIEPSWLNVTKGPTTLRLGS